MTRLFPPKTSQSPSQTGVSSRLAAFLAKWAKQTKPVAEGDRITLQGLDCTNGGSETEDLYFALAADHVSNVTALPVTLANQDFLSTNSLRNAFFPEIFRRHTDVNNLHLTLRGKGRFHLSLHAHDPKGEIRALGDTATETSTDTLRISLPTRHAIPEAARLEARVQSRAGKSQLQSLAWETKAPRDANGRMLVLLRSFGRSRNILALFSRLRQEAAFGDYSHFLRNTAFIILDVTEGVTPQDYAALTAGESFNIFAYSGANLGGGGNMSQIMLHARQALDAAQICPDEILLLDDDLDISLESLRRNWAASLFRADTTMFTAPIFRQNSRRTLWEDGSIWGRFAGGSLSGKREVLRPRFLRHGRKITATEGIEDFGTAHYPEYSTFIFQSLPYKAFIDIGYAAAFFLRCDDIEYSLRGRERGHGVISNPNLTAWHEPAHSYGQEYMAISHGLIVNLCYGQENVDTLVQFFLQRALSHLGVADPMGLDLYATVLADINDQNMFLTHDFAPRYLKRLAEFRLYERRFEHLPPEILQEILDQNDPRHGQAEHHFFMYMTPEYPLARSPGAAATHASEDFRRDTALRLPLTQVILSNPHSGTHYIYCPQEPAHGRALAKSAARLYAEIERFSAMFETLKAHYNERLRICMEEPFWQKELAMWEGEASVLTEGCRDG